MLKCMNLFLFGNREAMQSLKPLAYLNLNPWWTMMGTPAA